MKLEILPFSFLYLDSFLYKGVEREFFDSEEAVRQVIEERANRKGIALMGLYNEEPLFYMGIYFISSQVGEAWIFLNPSPPKLKITVSRIIHKTMYHWAKRLNLVRLQALCLPIVKTERFLEFLGFNYEATLCKYYEGTTDALIYAIIWEERCH